MPDCDFEDTLDTTGNLLKYIGQLEAAKEMFSENPNVTKELDGYIIGAQKLLLLSLRSSYRVCSTELDGLRNQR